MIRISIAFIIAFSLFEAAQAQEYRIARNAGRLELKVGRVTVEGHSGNEIILKIRGDKSDKDERADGLRLVSNLGLEDNTGLGIHVAEKDNSVEVHQIKTSHSPDLIVQVPKGVIVAFTYESQYGGAAKFSNLTNEIEISALYNSIELEEVTGPLTIQTTFGSVTARFTAPVKDPVSIVSIYGFIDVALPADTKADVKMSTSYGDLFIAPEFNLNVSSSEGGMEVYGNKLSGTLNGGGVDIDLDCNYGKVYLRRK